MLVATRQLTRIHRVGSTDVSALDGVDLDVERGEFLAVIGVSGSGKSTLLQLLGGLDTPTSGRITVDGCELAAMTSRERSLYRRTMVGFVFQFFYLIPRLTALANIELALTFQGTYGPARRALALEALERIGLSARAQHRPGQLSGGEQQRVALARAIVHRPQLLLADEPTGNLDHRTATEVVSVMRQVNREAGTTVVMVTHDEELAGRFADRTVRLRDGRLLDPAP